MPLVTVQTELLGRLCITAASYSTDQRSKLGPVPSILIGIFRSFRQHHQSNAGTTPTALDFTLRLLYSTSLPIY